MNNRDNVVVSPFLNGAYPLTYDRSDEGDTDAASAIASLVVLVGTLVLPYTISKISKHSQDKKSQKETLDSLHLYAMGTSTNTEDHAIAKKIYEIHEIDTKLSGMLDTNPQYKSLIEERNKLFDQHMELLKKYDRLAFFSGSHIDLIYAMVHRYYWFNDGIIKPSDHAAAIAEINSHIDKQKEFKYNKYDIDGLKKFVDALNDPRAKGKFVIICN